MKKDTALTKSISLLLTISLLAIFMPSNTLVIEYPKITKHTTTSQDSITRDYWPTDGWRNSTPQEHGMNNDTLYDMLDVIEAQEWPIRSIFIVKDGYVVFEEYLSDYYPATRTHLLHSVTKSFTSTLIGIALQQGLLSGINETILDFFSDYEVANPDPRKERMTIEDILTMTAGFDWDEWSTSYDDAEANTLLQMAYAQDCIQFVLDRPMAYEPGEHWTYNGGGTNLLGAIIPEISGRTTLQFARQHLFVPLGIMSSTWYMMNGGWYNCHGGLKLATQDIAKLGFLYLNNGNWNGTQILSEEFVTNATTPIDLRPYENEPEYGYGWQWWTRSDLGIYFAWGRHGQKILVSPEHDMVVAFNAMVPDYEYDPEFDLFYDYILRSIEEGPNYTNPSSSSLPVNEIVIVVLVAPVAIAAIYVLIIRTRYKE
ncbi:MAG: serine hydrolase domain-containing protein [Candidatus Thorarchaeota archaeon]|jgi:CubicO group peptidase (beta-lactamase class C family)